MLHRPPPSLSDASHVCVKILQYKHVVWTSGLVLDILLYQYNSLPDSP